MSKIKEMPDFKNIKYVRPDITIFRNTVQSVKLKLMTCKDVEIASQALFDYERELSNLTTMYALCTILHDLDTSNKYYADELEYCDEICAEVNELSSSVLSVLLTCPCADELKEKFGMMIFMKADNYRKTISKDVVDDIVKESLLQNEYSQLQSEAIIDFEGQKINLSLLGPYLESTDREVRKKAHKVLDQYYMTRVSEYDRIFDELVKLRTKIAHKLGYKSFTELGYQRMERYDYTREDVNAFREAILKYIVPITVQIRKNQQTRLDVEKLMFYDLPCLFKHGNPVPTIDKSDYNKVSGEFFARILGVSPSFFDVLYNHGFTDLLSRPNKATGGYCMYLDNYAIPYIFMNGNGTADDISTIVHEGGHAYAAIKSSETSPFIECLSPTLETCEIHSTAMEFLSYPYMEMFYGENADAYRQLHMTNALLFLPYGCMVDEFQHIIYDNPDMLPSDRHEVWRKLEEKYQPGINYEEHPFHAMGAAWMKKEHIFTTPFYYIDYCLSHVVALNLWEESKEDFRSAMIKYDTLCELGGNYTFKKILESAELMLPFDSGVIKKLAFDCCKYLEL